MKNVSGSDFEKLVFEDNNISNLLKDWLNLIGNINCTIIKRDIWENLEEIIDINNSPKILYLPEDLVYLELLEIVSKINNKLNIKNDYFNEVCSFIKVAIYKLFKSGEINNDTLTHWIGKYKISQDLISHIKNSQTDIGIKYFKNYKKGEAKLAKAGVNLNKLLKIINNCILESIDTIGLEVGKLNIYDLITSFTQKEYEDLEKNFPNEINDKKIIFRINKEQLSKDEKRISEIIGVENTKKKLENYKLKGNFKRLYQEQLKILSILNSEIFKYAQSEIKAFKSNQDIINKKISCLERIILMHIFLEKLDIPHYGILQTRHVALSIKIGNTNYYADPTHNKELYTIKTVSTTKIGEYSQAEISSKSDHKEILIQQGNIKKIILSTIFNNLGDHYSSLNDYHKALLCCYKSILIYPRTEGAYLGLHYTFAKIGYWKYSLESLKTTLKINPTRNELSGRMGLAYYKNNEYENAVPYLIKSLDNTTTPREIYFMLAECYVALKQDNNALKVYLLGCKRFPTLHYFYDALGKLHSKLENHFESIKYFEIAYTKTTDIKIQIELLTNIIDEYKKIGNIEKIVYYNQIRKSKTMTQEIKGIPGYGNIKLDFRSSKKK